VRIRRAPRLGIFLALGGALGLIAALVLTTVFDVDPNVGFTGTFAYIALYSIPIGIALLGVVGLIIDRVSRSRATTVSAEHDVTQASPAADADDRP